MTDKKKKYPITFKNFIILYYNMLNNLSLSDDHADYTQEEIENKLKGEVKISVELFEHLLYCSNIANEEGRFWHPSKKDFNQFLQKALPNSLDFDYQYNLLQDRSK